MANALGILTDEITLNTLSFKGLAAFPIKAIGRISINITPTIVGAASSGEQTFIVPGLMVGDFVSVTPPSVVLGCIPACARVSAANTLAIAFLNPTALGIIPSSGIYQLQVVR